MNNKYLVSVIIPFFNSEKFLKESIESVIGQIYQNWELLLVDDGSEDRGTQIALDYAKHYPDKIRFLEHVQHINKGTCASRNLGIRHAKGKYIALLDSDDIWMERKLEQQMNIMELHNDVSFIFGTSLYWYSWSGKSDDMEKDKISKINLESDTIYNPPSLLTSIYPLGRGSAPCPSNLLIKKEAIDKIGGFEESFTGIYQLYEDQAFLTKLYLNFKAYVKDECWIKYRIHPDSCDSKVIQAGQYSKVRMYYLFWLKDYFNKRNVEDKLIWKAFNKRFDKTLISVKKDLDVFKVTDDEINDKQIEFIDKLQKSINSMDTIKTKNSTMVYN